MDADRRRRLAGAAWLIPRLSLAAGLAYGALYYAAPGRFAYNLRFPRSTDFALYYREASIGVRHGWAHVYDLDLFLRATRELGIISRDTPELGSLGLPQLDWLVSPLTLLPLDVAYFVWLAVLLAALVVTVLLMAPTERRSRRAHAFFFAFFAPAIAAVALGQAVVLVLLGLAAGAVLLRRGHDGPAGVALGLTLVKPQLVLLLPLCLLAAGRWRAVASWAVVGAAVAVGALVVTGPGPLLDLARRLMSATQHASTWQVISDVAPAAALTGAARGAFQVAVAAVSALAAWGRRAERGSERAVAAGLVGSLLVTPYIHFQDLSVLFVVAWLVLAARPHPVERWLMQAGYFPAAIAISLLPVMEAGWLVAEAASATRRARPPAEGTG